MNLSSLSIKRPVFITCVLLLIIVIGLFSFKKLPVDLFPDVTFPIVTVTVPYPGSGPKEVELLVSKPLEEEIGTISGLKTVRSVNNEGVAIVVAEFTLETDVKYAEQQVRDKVSSARRKLPDDIEEPTIRRIDPSDQPVMMITLKAEMKPGELFDLADQVIRPKLEQVKNVGLVEVVGGRKREIHIELDRKKLSNSNLSASMIANNLAAAGQNIPSGSVSRESNGTDMVFRTVGEFKSVQEIKDSSVSFYGNDVSLTLQNVGKISDTLEDAKTYTFWNGNSTLILNLYKQSGTNTIEVSNNVQKQIDKITTEINERFKDAKPELKIVSNQARYISLNVEDVFESILIGILLTIIVVYFFLGSMRSTLITGVAIPVSLIGAAGLMLVAGFSINIMSLLAFSLAVGLLIDDAIVVRENIFRHMEMGKSARESALIGTTEVTLAVVAVTLTIIAVFLPIGFLSGVVGQFFKQFGITVCFVMLISLFDALTNAPMMSAYFGGKHGVEPTNPIMVALRSPVHLFNRMQDSLENKYSTFLKWIIKRPWVAIVGSLLVVASSCVPLMKVPKTFLPPQDSGEFAVGLDMPPGTSLEKMRDEALKVDAIIRKNPTVVNTVLTVGNKQGEKNKAEFFVNLTPFGTRTKSTSDVKEDIRQALKEFKDMNPKVKDVDYVGGGMRPFTLNIAGQDLKQIEEVTTKLYAKLKDHPALTDVDISYRPGKPEFQVAVDLKKAQRLGVSIPLVGRELRAQVEGVTPAVFRENGLEYDIRVRMQPDQRDLEEAFPNLLVPNLNYRLVNLSDVATGIKTEGPANIDRENRGRYISINADIAPDGPGMGGAIDDVRKWIGPGGELELPAGITYRFVGQAENFEELVSSMITAMFLGLIFIYLVLSSLYESFFTPFTIMMVIPLAACGAFFALYIGGKSLDLYSMIGCIMLMGLATKNSIILIDYIRHLTDQGTDLKTAIVEGGKTRLRPILMTSFALIAGMIPVAYGLNEVSNQRTSLGWAVIGGVVSSTFLTLIVTPAVYAYMESARAWLTKNIGSKLVTQDD